MLPLIVGDFMLSLNNAGIAYCYDAATGKVLWKERSADITPLRS